MSVELSDLRLEGREVRSVLLCEHGMDSLHSTSACAQHEGVHKEQPDCYCDEARYLDASEVASACPTEVLIAVLVERGVLTQETTEGCYACDRDDPTPHPWDTYVSSRRFVSEYEYGKWPVAGGVS